MSERILVVDDDPTLLRGCQRALRGRFEIEVAGSGEEALVATQDRGPFAVVLSDMRMPGIDGVRFLEQVARVAPDTVRMMLTGHADTAVAMAAVNEGNVFRFLTKPCATEDLVRALQAGVQQYRLVRAERDLLEDTLRGAIRVCSEILATLDSETYGRAQRVQEAARQVGKTLGVDDLWRLEVAALLARIGWACVPPDVVLRQRREALQDGDQAILERIPQTGHDLLAKIPRLQEVARTVRYAEKNFDGSGFPADELAGAAIPLHARILRVCVDLIDLEAKNQTRYRALALLGGRTGRYDPAVLEAARSGLAPPPNTAVGTGLEVDFAELQIGDVLLSNVETESGVLVVQAGAMLTGPLLLRIRNFVDRNPLRLPIRVERGGCVPVEEVRQ
jgi:response regulator RpfG family c-di-GMP phosphodiesterase